MRGLPYARFRRSSGGVYLATKVLTLGVALLWHRPRLLEGSKVAFSASFVIDVVPAAELGMSLFPTVSRAKN